MLTLGDTTQSGLNKKDLIEYNENLKAEMFKELRDVLPRQTELITVAYCDVDPSELNIKNLGQFTRSLKIVGSRGYAIAKDRNGTVVGTIQKMVSSTYARIGSLPTYEVERLKMIDYVQKWFSKNCFLISFSDIEPTYLVGFFIADDSVGFLNSNFEVINVIDAIINETGSIEKYFESIELKMVRNKLLIKVTNPSNAKEFLKRDYLNYQKVFPSDTTGTLRLLFEEIQRSCGTSDAQVKLISRQVRLSSTKKTMPEFNGLGVFFYGKDISYCIRSVLTRSQYEKFIYERELNSWLASQASNILYMYLYQEKKIPPDRIPEIMKLEIYGD
jgi:hypothetical protein